jgi:LysR family glycine cleavage system transcriptional activator
MAQRLPPLPALRAFEAVARLGSLKDAADELLVSHSAISHQIKQLQDWLEQRLFDRTARGLRLTAAGERYKRVVCEAFREIAVETASLRGRESANVRLSVLPLFAVAWLLPRLPDFWARHPEIDVTVGYTRYDTEIGAERADLTVRFGTLAAWPDRNGVVLFTGAGVPVCSPAYLENRRIRQPRDLLSCALLHDGDSSYWKEWFRREGLPAREAERGQSFTDGNLTLASTLAGEGVALLRRALIGRQIRARALVQLFDRAVDENTSYLLLWRREPLQRSALLLRDWIIDQAAEDQG